MHRVDYVALLELKVVLKINKIKSPSLYEINWALIKYIGTFLELRMLHHLTCAGKNMLNKSMILACILILNIFLLHLYTSCYESENSWYLYEFN